MSTWILVILLNTAQFTTPYPNENACYEALEAMRVGNEANVVAYCRPWEGE